ncbi:PREDICTED: uncharacterized protein LOC107531780 [Miniopterus natalensis]|uniref:uncharacterized protein LOC107531780 n=1 Tax=Miniopterus natalensis TaxID=291302 RepID=UPI0007A6EC69|nr:PREDICTED: uncharacterized protein LOC107531780 [Miniopterus natalensis]
MSQSDQQNNQSDLLPEAPNNNTQDEAQDPSPITYMPRDSAQDPPPSILYTRRVSIQEHPPTVHTRRVSIQEHPPTVHTRRVSIQEHPLILHTPPILHTRRVSTQETAPISNDNQTSTQETPPPISSSRRVSIQETPPIIHSSHFNTRDVPPSFQTRRFSVRRSSLVSPIPLTCIQSVACTTEDTSEDDLPTTQTRHLSIKGSKVASRAQVDVPPSITNSPQASIESIDSILCASQEVFKDSLYSFQFSTSSDDSTIYSIPPGSFVASSSGFQSGQFRRYSQLPIGTRLLHEAKKISRLLSLVLSLFGMAILSLITLGQPWIHFQVPLLPPGDPAGPKTIPINTIFFLRCADISCLREQDHKACKACLSLPTPGTHFSSVPGAPSCLPWDDPTAPGLSCLLCDGPHSRQITLPSPGWSPLPHPHRLAPIFTYTLHPLTNLQALSIPSHSPTPASTSSSPYHSDFTFCRVPNSISSPSPSRSPNPVSPPPPAL